MSGGPAPPPPPPAWVVEDAWEAQDAWRTLPGEPPFGVANSGAVRDEQRAQWQQRHGTADTFFGSLRYDRFATTPHVAAPASLALDWMWRDGLCLASPRLFALLDQPCGSLQALPTRTEWAGPDAPGFSYLWLSHIPTVSALDLDRCAGDVERITRDGVQVQVLRPSGGGQRLRLRLRSGFAPPCGLFWAAEGTNLLMASDAVANAVLRAGGTGLEFLHPEAPSAGEDDCLRRTLDGVEPHPRGVARREAQANAAPYVPREIMLPPLGPVLHWDHSALDLLIWDDADAELAVYMAGGDKKDYASLLSRLLGTGISSSESSVQGLLAAIADVRTGRTECWTTELPDELMVTVRPDAVWLDWEHAHLGKQLRAFPLDGIEEVLRRWALAIRRYEGEEE